ncbi:hypothetical protein [Nocardia farcinica]|uniref:hypothetical protein n=1 Tax=Nocardia farcinica TaxID=37329 RepID=UPI001895D989|nr:hypothetical protein [Nocardia farcinica]MBF6072082.1 hypothetical protein [Nocardia farcinica]MBF6266241.1 hypothetical protein [Nocardia farcinica]MCZ9325440.1 hypothetical protein [Nocardia farcinica]
MQAGDLVRVTESGISVFRIVQIDGEQAFIEASELPEDAPGRYPFPVPLSHLVPADAAERPGSGE